MIDHRVQLRTGTSLIADDVQRVMQPRDALRTAESLWRDPNGRSKFSFFLSFDSTVPRPHAFGRSDPLPYALKSDINTGRLLLLRHWNDIFNPLAEKVDGEWQLVDLNRESILFRSTLEQALKRSGWGGAAAVEEKPDQEPPRSFADSVANNKKFGVGGTASEAKSDHFKLDLQCLWDNGEALGEIPILLSFDGGENQRHLLPANGHLKIDSVPSANYKVQLNPDEDGQALADTRREIQQILDDIIRDEEAEAAAHQATQDRMNPLQNAAVHTGAVIWGLWQWGKDTVIAAKEISDLVNPVVQLNHALQAAFATRQLSPGDRWISTFQQQFSDRQHREVVEALGFDPSTITKEHLAQAYEIASFVKEDAPTRSALGKFAVNFVAAQDSVELHKALAPELMEMIITAVLIALTSGAAGIVVGVKIAKRLPALGRKLELLSRQLKALKIKRQRAMKHSNQHETLEVKRPTPPVIEEPKKVNGDRMLGENNVPDTTQLSRGEALRQKYSHLSTSDRKTLVSDRLEGYAENRLDILEQSIQGAHFKGRHGAQTTLDDQLNRAVNGIDPVTKQPRYRRNGNLVTPNSTRFNSHRDQYSAIQRASTIYQNTGSKVLAERPIMFRSQAGEGYYGGSGAYDTSFRAQVWFNRNADPITAFPILGQ